VGGNALVWLDINELWGLSGNKIMHVTPAGEFNSEWIAVNSFIDRRRFRYSKFEVSAHVGA
jgi:hypothetical protein